MFLSHPSALIPGGIPTWSFSAAVGRCLPLSLPSSACSPGDWCQPASLTPTLFSLALEALSLAKEGVQTGLGGGQICQYQTKLPMQITRTVKVWIHKHNLQYTEKLITMFVRPVIKINTLVLRLYFMCIQSLGCILICRYLLNGGFPPQHESP